LTGLLATGNMPNLQALAGGLPADYCNATVSGSQIDQFAKAGLSEDDKSYASTWEPWYAFTDAEDKGSSTITNSTTKKIVWDKKTGKCVERSDNYNVIAQDGSDWVARINSYTLNQGNNEWHPYVALGLDAQNNGKAGYYNFSGCTGGFSYQYKGAAHNFKVQLSTVTDYGYHFMPVGSGTTSSWTTVVAAPSDLQQEAWPVKVTFDLSKIVEFAWELKGDGTNDGKAITGISPKTGSLAIKDFKCIGTMTFPAEKRLKCEEGGTTPSSSSKASSSSVASGTSSSAGNSSSSVRSSSSAISSSSVASGTSSSSSSLRSSSSAISSSSSSSSAANTPVLVAPLAHSNALIAMQNAVNVQVTGNAVLQIYDSKGNAIRSLRVAQGSYVVSLADLPRGLYIVKASNASWQQTIKLAVN
ncbi:MAG: T9SS type A sorting domain-containing protein, partial [Fibromonadales bacterium]|nr:T9SS type A sorting domain-containing protein [Fibromonadales bacterium]